MPAIDNLFGNGAIHIADRNKKKPIATLCGQALDKETIRYFEDVTNFDQATCKVCRKSFFDEDWGKNDETQSSEIPRARSAQQQEQDSAPPADPPVEAPRRLFGGLSVPINSHGPKADRQLPEE